MISTDYKIIGFNTSIGQLTIQFDCVNYPVLLDLYLDEDGQYPEGEVLDNYIRTICPVGVVEREQKISEGISNEKNILSLVQVSEKQTEDEEQSTEFIGDENYLNEQEMFELKVSLVVQKMVAEMFGATV